MKVTLKLFATLADYLPPGHRNNKVDLDLSDGTSVAQVVASLQLPERLTHLVLVNGHYITPAERPTTTLRNSDQLAIWPPIAGG